VGKCCFHRFFTFQMSSFSKDSNLHQFVTQCHLPSCMCNARSLTLLDHLVVEFNDLLAEGQMAAEEAKETSMERTYESTKS
jgi:hypothetical protein